MLNITMFGSSRNNTHIMCLINFAIFLESKMVLGKGKWSDVNFFSEVRCCNVLIVFSLFLFLQANTIKRLEQVFLEL